MTVAAVWVPNNVEILWRTSARKNRDGPTFQGRLQGTVSEAVPLCSQQVLCRCFTVVITGIITTGTAVRFLHGETESRVQGNFPKTT